MIAANSLAPVNAPELAVMPGAVEGGWDFAVGDRNSWSPDPAAQLGAMGPTLLAPYRCAKHDPDPARSRVLGRVRYRVDTTFGRLVERRRAKRVRAPELCDQCSRLLRKVLGHALAVLPNVHAGNEPRRLARLLA